MSGYITSNIQVLTKSKTYEKNFKFSQTSSCILCHTTVITHYIKSVYLYLPPISMSYFAGKVGMAVGCLKKNVEVSHTVIS